MILHDQHDIIDIICNSLIDKLCILNLQYLVSNEEFERTKEIVAEFGKPGGVGEELQRRLLERAETKESWVRKEMSQAFSFGVYRDSLVKVINYQNYQIWNPKNMYVVLIISLW